MKHNDETLTFSPVYTCQPWNQESHPSISNLYLYMVKFIIKCIVRILTLLIGTIHCHKITKILIL